MKICKILLICFSLLVLGGSTVLATVPLNLDEDSAQVESNLVLPLRGEEKNVLDERMPVDVSSMNPSFGIQNAVVQQITEHPMEVAGYENMTLQVNLQFNPDETAYYHATTSIYTNNSFNRVQIGNSYGWGQTIAVGIPTVAKFSFCGYYIWESGVDGPYAIYMTFYKDNGSIYYIYNNDNVLNTTNYLATDFHAPAVVPNEAGIYHTFIDADANGFYEWIDISIPVNVSVAGKYKFWGQLSASNGGSSDSSKTEIYLSEGSKTVVIRFSGWEFKSMVTGPLNFDLSIEHINFPYNWGFYYGTDIYVTGSVTAGSFDVPPILITNIFYEELDINPKGYYEIYRIILTLNITRSEDGYMNLYSTLVINDSQEYIQDRGVYNIQLDSTGFYNVTYEFAGLHIYKSNINYDHLTVQNFYGYYYHPDGNYGDYCGYANRLISKEAYHYSQFEGPGAYLTDNFIDYGEDTDIPTDGLYNKLIVEVQINVTKVGQYSVSSWLDENGTGYTIAHASKSDYYAVGLHWVKLEYDGLAFFDSGISNFIKFQYLTLYDETFNTNIDYNNTAVLTNYYSYTDFNPPKIYLTYTYADTPIGIQGNYSGIQLSVEVEVVQSGRYRAYGYLHNPITAVDLSTYSVSYYSGIGTVRLNLTFDQSQWFWSQRTNTSYLLEYVRIDEVDDEENTIRTWDYIYNNYTTSIYKSNDFAAPVAFFTGNFVEDKIDLNEDGDFDVFIVSVEIEATKEVYIELSGYLYNDISSYSRYNYTLISEGPNWVEMYYPTLNLYKTAGNRSYRIDFSLYDDETNVFLDSYYYYQTNFYENIIWNSPNVEFTGNIYDFGFDSDGNGKFDCINFSVELNVIEAGNYHLYGYVYADEGYSSFYCGTGYQNLGVGLQNITFQVDNNWVRNQPDGKKFYLSYVRVYENIAEYGFNYEVLYDGLDRYFSRIYYHAEFDLLDAWVSGVIDDYGVDIDNDTLFDFWYVVFQINVTVSEFNGYLWARIEEKVTTDFISEKSKYFYGLSQGLNNITLEFDGVNIYESGFTGGAYVDRYYLQETYYWRTLDDSEDDIPLYGANNYTQFTDTPPNYLEITYISHSEVILERDDVISFEVGVQKYGTAEIDQISIEVTIDGEYYNSWGLSYSWGDNPEYWSVSIQLEEGGLWEIEIIAFDYGISEDTAYTSFYVLGGPIFFGFTANTSSLMVDEAVHFEADVWDEDGIQSLELNIEGQSETYTMVYSGNASYGELWTVDVVFDTVGQFTVFIIGKDMNGTSSQSTTLTIYVNEGPRIVSVDVQPGTTVDIGTKVEFTVTVENTVAIITSVTLEVEDEDGIHYLEALEETGRSDFEVTFYGTFTPKKPGTHICTIIVLTTKNQQSMHEVRLEVRGSPKDLQIAPGFEFVFTLGLFVLLPILKKLKRK